jgi:predicted Zn-dependent protease
MNAASQAPRRRAALCLGLVALLAAAGYAAFPLVRGEYHARAGLAAAERRDFSAAHEQFVRALEDRPGRPELHLLAARCARRAGLYSQAADHLADCQRLHGSADAVSLERALLVATRGQLSEDVEAYLRQYADSAEALEALSRGYCKAHRLASARTCLARWLEREPDSLDALLLRGWVAERQNRHHDAADDYRRAAALDGGHREARLRLAKVLLDGTRQTEQAAAVFVRLWQEAPGAVEVGVGLALCRARTGQPEEAARLLDELLDHNPNDATLLIERGKLALDMDDPAAARGWLEKGVARAPYHYRANYALYRCLAALGESDGARRALEQSRRIEADRRRLDGLIAALNERPHSPELRTEIGEIYLRHGEPEEAAFWLTGALESAPDYEPARRLLADAGE